MNKVMGNKKTIALFVLPAFIIYAIFALAPIFYNVYLSLFDTDLMSKMNFVGIKNYLSLFSDKTFKHAFGNNILMVVGSLVAHMPLAMFFGNAIFKKIKGASFFQTVFFLPCVICGVAVGLTWTFVYNGNYGLLNGFLKAIGLGGLQQMWLANKETAMLCIIIVIMWQYVGYHMVIQLAAMRNIDSSFYEAAEIDGATGWQQFKYITFPLIKPILKIDAVLIITGSLKYYDLVAVMTSGGPNHATEVMSTYMYYQSFNILNYGYASAIGVFVQSSGAIKSILTDIAQNYEQNISLADLAEKYHFSESYISRKIKKETGYTFVDILNGIRLMCAASLLKTGEKISDVCEKTGFNDQHYFSQLFKKTFGCTPSNYRSESGETFSGLYEILNSKAGNGK